MDNFCLKLTPLIGDGNTKQVLIYTKYISESLKLTPLIGDGNE